MPETIVRIVISGTATELEDKINKCIKDSERNKGLNVQDIKWLRNEGCNLYGAMIIYKHTTLD